MAGASSTRGMIRGYVWGQTTAANGASTILGVEAAPHVPRWPPAGRSTIVLGALWLLAVIVDFVVDARPGSPGHAPWEWRAGTVLAVGALWLIEFQIVAPRSLRFLPPLGRPWARGLLVVAMTAPVAWLNVVREGALAILFLCCWWPGGGTTPPDERGSGRWA